MHPSQALRQEEFLSCFEIRVAHGHRLIFGPKHIENLLVLVDYSTFDCHS